MTALLWASFIVCAVVGILAMAIFAAWLFFKAVDWWLDVQLATKAVHDVLWKRAQEEDRRGARRRERVRVARFALAALALAVVALGALALIGW